MSTSVAQPALGMAFGGGGAWQSPQKCCISDSSRSRSNEDEELFSKASMSTSIFSKESFSQPMVEKINARQKKHKTRWLASFCFKDFDIDQNQTKVVCYVVGLLLSVLELTLIP